MFKLIKYELRSTFLTIIGICISVIIANLFLMTKKDTWGGNTVTALSTCLIIGAMIVIFISSLKIMSKYLYGDSGYLLFTLPQSGSAIMTSRLISALIQISIVAFVSILMLYLTSIDKIDLSFFKYFKLSVVLFFIIQYIWGIVYLLTFIYFCMVIGKVALRGKKLGKIGSFIIFIILSIAIGWLSTKITTLLPQNLNLNKFSINTTNSILNSDLMGSGGELNLNIADTIFQIITFVGLFISTTYLIDKKLDLS
ncbi:hypothetical protein K2F40_11525 [Clostridium sp. CM028]|uniref:hypothetical protein n=1 Tax=unclassified Clostridium TaxID=2614128 RepID=UPI001C6E331F|nr:MULTISPECIES: hypothetical protein [unclassified Clostridium]MBW9145901.1 hypothetical protein [Clostridium sp. CM027]MBW9149590.1 hypothetical protein [Clostridium sp. CM028]UVE40880.1 hypothetical protein KTC92_17755 [Clostridium sp. CM027]WLC61548.1 hypothetical protein KTC94_16040 [Clostridium sp. CM028]